MSSSVRWVLFVGAAIGLLALARAPRSGVPTAPPSPAAASPWQGSVAAEGRVVTYPGRQVTVSATRAGLLERVLVSERQSVRRGALLAEVESSELRATLAEVHAQLEERTAEARLAEATFERQRGLAAQGVLSLAELDLARRDVDTTAARLSTVQATRARIEAQLRLTRVLAPIDGTVLELRAHSGETAAIGTPVVVLADLAQLRIEAETDEADIARIRVGAPASVSALAFPGRTWRAHVEEIPDEVNLRRLKFQDPTRPTDTRVVAVKLAFDESHPLRLGTTVDLVIHDRPGPADMPRSARPTP